MLLIIEITRRLKRQRRKTARTEMPEERNSRAIQSQDQRLIRCLGPRFRRSCFVLHESLSEFPMPVIDESRCCCDKTRSTYHTSYTVMVESHAFPDFTHPYHCRLSCTTLSLSVSLFLSLSLSLSRFLVLSLTLSVRNKKDHLHTVQYRCTFIYLKNKTLQKQKWQY